MTNTRPELRIFDEAVIREVVDDATAMESAERAFATLARGGALIPPPLGMELDDADGEVHVKGAYLQEAPIFVFKVATGFYRNAAADLPSGSGLVLVFDAATGFPLGVLADNGYLTDLRTAAAGALAVRLLAPDRPLVVAVLGAGVQGRLQLRLASRVRPLREVRIWSPREEEMEAYAAEMEPRVGIPIHAAPGIADALVGADLVITATPSRTPLVLPGMLEPGATVVALGSDGPDKCELNPRVVAAADKVVTDHTAQCAHLGELHHALEAGLMTAGDVHAELGSVLVGDAPGREGGETVVCDLTGVGAQDAAIAEAAWSALTTG
jgi:ornithine cyclodeaminase